MIPTNLNFPRLVKLENKRGILNVFDFIDIDKATCIICSSTNPRHYAFVHNYLHPGIEGSRHRTTYADFLVCDECAQDAEAQNDLILLRKLQSNPSVTETGVEPLMSAIRLLMAAIGSKIDATRQPIEYGFNKRSDLEIGSLGVSGVIHGRERDAHAWLLTRAFDRGNFRLFYQRFQVRYSFAIPSREALEVIVKHSPNGLLDYGAGNAYWSMLLRERGLDVLAIDCDPLPTGRNSYYSSHHVDKADRRPWTIVEEGSIAKLVNSLGAKTLLLAFPPPNSDMAFEALERSKAETVIHIGPPNGITTGSELFHAVLRKRYQLVDEVLLPNFIYMDDRVQVFNRI